MRFKIVERYFPPTKKLTEQQAQRLLKTTFSEATKVTPIYRGIYEHDYTTPILVTPDPATLRRSRNAYSNYYTLIINNAPAWKNYPKRQTICSTSLERVISGYADNNKQAFRVYPKNGAKIGIVPDEDIWVTGFNDANNSLEQLFDFVGIMQADGYYNEFTRACGVIDDWKETMKKNRRKFMELTSYGGMEINKYITGKIKFLDFVLKEWVSPKKFHVTTIGQFSADYNQEVWTDAPTIMIPVSKKEYYDAQGG